jgi:universal stress protein A
MKTLLEEVKAMAQEAPSLVWGRILVPVDFTPAAIAAIQYAGAVARRDGASVCLAHVVEPISGCEDVNLFRSDEELAQQAEVGLAELARRWLPAEAPVRVLVQRGKPAVEIVHLAASLQCDVIILGTHQVPWWGRWWHRGVAQRIMGKASCSVFLLQSAQARELNPVYWESTASAEAPVN